MSSLQVVAAAVGRHFAFADYVAAEALPSLSKKLPQAEKFAGVTSASRLQQRPAPEMVSSGIAEIDALTGGLPRGCLTEICGPASSGRTSFLLAAIAAATQREEVCALVDVSNALDPQSAAAAGVDLQKMLWVRCSAGKQTVNERTSQNHRAEFAALENALRVTDLLLQSSGFGMVVIDLADISFRAARRVPLTSWFRFRRAVENTNTLLLVSTRQPCAQTCASLLLQMQASGVRLQAQETKLPAISGQLSAENIGHHVSGARLQGVQLPTHAQLLQGLNISAQLLRSRLERKPGALCGGPVFRQANTKFHNAFDRQTTTSAQSLAAKGQ